MSSKRVWVVLPDQLSTRLFVDTGILTGLSDRLDGAVDAVLVGDGAGWSEGTGGVPAIAAAELASAHVSVAERLHRSVDRGLDRSIGYYPLAIRLSLRHGFHRERMAPGHENWMLDSSRVGPLPRWDPSSGEWLPGTSAERVMCHARSASVCAATAAHSCSRMSSRRSSFRSSCRRVASAFPIVAHVASWDHTVGKGVIAPFCDVYIVQNATMRDDLTRYHEIDPGRIVVTGWPQTDVYARQRPREDFDAVVRSFDLDPALPLVAVMGNTPTNAPFEDRFVERLVRWWEAEGRGRMTLLFRPHPRDRAWRERFAAALSTSGVHVQEASFTDLDVLATILQHASCVVANAGTILLEALVNDRPAVCVLYDEGAPPGESWAMKNVIGEHYRELATSDAFYPAKCFEDVVSGIERSLATPGRARRRTRARRRRSSATWTGWRRSVWSTRSRIVVAEPMKLVMTLLARNEADIVDAQLAFHLNSVSTSCSRPTTDRTTARRRSSSDTSARVASISSASPATTCVRPNGSRGWPALPRPSSAPTG